MKNIILICLFSLIVVSCGNTKRVVSEPTEIDKNLIIEDKMIINKEIPINKKPVISEIPKTVETPQIVETPPTPPKVNPEEVTIKQEVDPVIIAPVETVSLSHESFNTLLKNNVSAAGNVNYEGFKRNRKILRDYIAFLGENVPTDNWTKNEKLAYWMNAYNAMTIDLIMRNSPLESIKDIKKPWDQRLWKLSDKWYNLEEIEHKILRKMGDARIHFGINCASFSCPPLLNEAFTPTKVDQQLTQVARKFVNDSSRNMISENNIEISKIFDWFAKDFKQNGSVIDYLNQFSTVKISEGAKVRFMDYNWELNN